MRFAGDFFIHVTFTMLFAFMAKAQMNSVNTPELAAEKTAKMPVIALPISEFKLISRGTGWVLSGSRLLLTTDNGAHWKDISPPISQPDYPDQYASIFLLDENTGWVLFAHLNQDDDFAKLKGTVGDWTFHLFSTENGGATWKEDSLPIWRGDRELIQNGIVSFADKLHGWLGLETAGSTMTAGSELLMTSDGGRTWRDIPDAQEDVEGAIHGLLVRTKDDIWLLCSPEGGSALWATHDGGKSYKNISLPAPHEIAPLEDPTYDIPVFTDRLNGYEVVTYSDGNFDNSAAVLYATSDGGRTWKQDRILVNLSPGSVGGRESYAIAGSDWILPYNTTEESRPRFLRMTRNSGTTSGSVLAQSRSDCTLGYAAELDGWMNCPSGLFSTVDGGTTWTNIQPRTRNGVFTQDPATPPTIVPVQIGVPMRLFVPGEDRNR